MIGKRGGLISALSLSLAFLFTTLHSSYALADESSESVLTTAVTPVEAVPTDQLSEGSQPNETTNPNSPLSGQMLTGLETLELGAVRSVDSVQLSILALSVLHVEKARKPAGARWVAHRILTKEYKWSLGQYKCLSSLWERESHWNYKAHNIRSGAHGIAQASPPSKMSVIASDWRTNPVTQIRWGLRYIKMRYGTPCNALAKSHRSGYY